LRFKLRRNRAGVSEVMSSLIMISITLVAGAAAFGFVNGQLGVSANAYGNQAAGNINYLNERETVPLVNFPGSGITDNQVMVWVQNTGNIPLTGYSIVVTGPYCATLTDICATPAGTLIMKCVQGGACWAYQSTSGQNASVTNFLSPVPKGVLTSFTLSMPILFAGVEFRMTSSSAPTAVFTISFSGQFGSQASYTKVR
jgi:hypothetical protein